MTYNDLRKKISEKISRTMDELERPIDGYGLLIKIEHEVLPIAFGMMSGALGRTTGQHWIPIVPLGMDILGGGAILTTPRGVWTYLKYGIGVALPYTREIYAAAQEVLRYG